MFTRLRVGLVFQSSPSPNGCQTLPSQSNPFASRYVRPGALPFRFRSNDRPDAIVAQLREVRFGAIVGDHGTGKSTLLRELAGHLEEEMPGGQWVQLTRDENPGLVSGIANSRVVLNCQRLVSAGGVLVIDGGEQLPSLARRIAARRTRRCGHFCLLTAHDEIPGFEILYRTSLDVDLIHELIAELLPPPLLPTDEVLRQRIYEHVAQTDLTTIDNLRVLWDQLYEVAELVYRGELN